jgi:hypothetical protein
MLKDEGMQNVIKWIFKLLLVIEKELLKILRRLYFSRFLGWIIT